MSINSDPSPASPPTADNGEGQTWRCCRCGETTTDVAQHFRFHCEVVAGD